MHPRVSIYTALTAALTIISSCAKHENTSGHAAPPASGHVAPAGSTAPAGLTAPTGVARTVKGDGITITETADGQVILKTTSRWNDVLETTYQDCTYYRNAVPVLANQVSEERAKLLGQICVGKP